MNSIIDKKEAFDFQQASAQVQPDSNDHNQVLHTFNYSVTETSQTVQATPIQNRLIYNNDLPSNSTLCEGDTGGQKGAVNNVTDESQPLQTVQSF